MPIASFRPPTCELAWSTLGRRLPLAATLLAVALTLVGVLTWQVNNDAGIIRIDPRVLDWMIAHRGEPLTSIARFVTDLGDTLSMTILATLTVAWFAARRDWATVALVALTSAGAGVLVVVIKRLVGRHRPPEVSRLVAEPSLSYPSGHTLGTTVVVGIVALTVIPGLRRRWLRVAATVFAVLFPIAVGLSRIYLGVHWSTDVLAGWIFGLAWLTLCVTVFAWVYREHFAPAAPAEVPVAVSGRK
ncbi:phosphatase PAP2 family protein [Nocardia neocaledoniensis]|uniref:phosphatase PAP2 family protein n=1 Tax=Nocardia neocaledoniensis TaxID=236511 RepID=UPI0033C5016E